MIFTALATAALAAIGISSTFAVTALAAGLALATNIGLNYVVRALSGEPASAKQDSFGVQGQLNAGGAVPRSFGLGKHVTGGSLVYCNYWGWHAAVDEEHADTPNAYLTQVIALSDLPREQLLELWVNGEKCTIYGSDTGMGRPVAEYDKDGESHLWIRYHDGTQTAADPFLMSAVSSADRPWGPDRIGTGVCYVICTSLVEDTLFTGFPTFKFVLSGVPLYDPSKDSTNGGSGPHRYSDPSTWGGDGDQLPAVQAYNVLRGIKFNGAWLYGLQNTGQARLPAANWIAQINKCRALIDGEDGPEPTYRSGGQINVDTQPANAIEEFLTACQGRLSEIGGFYKIHLGAPDSPVFAWTDADLLSSESQTFRPFFSLNDSVNGIQGTYPDPDQGWETATAPPLYRTDLEARDGSRRLMASPQFNFVPYAAQVQRLQKSGIEEAQRARTHVIAFPPAYWMIEPGDVGTWTSFRNGYEDKLFRVDSVVDKANLDTILNVTEIDPADYDWDHATDYQGVTIGPTVIPRPPPQGVNAWFAEPVILYDDDGIGRRPAIRIAWDGTVPGVIGIQYEVRLALDLSSVTRGRSDQLQAGAILISEGIVPVTAYQVRGQYIPNAPRDMLWTDWLDVTTGEIPTADIPAAIAIQVTEVMDYLADRLTEVEQRTATVNSKLAAQDYEEIRSVRQQTSAVFGKASARIDQVETVAVDANEAVAALETSVTAQFADTNANVTTNATAIADINEWASAQYGVTLNVNGYATGFNLVNGGAGFSTTTFLTDKFQVAAPSGAGSAPVPIFTIADVGGSPKVAIRGDMYADGTITGTKLVAATITGDKIAANAITAAKIDTHTITTNEIAVGGVDLINIVNGAASNTAMFATSAVSGAFSATTIVSQVVNIQSGKATMRFSGQWGVPPLNYGGNQPKNGVNFYLDGVLQKTFTWTMVPAVFVASSFELDAPITVEHTMTGLSAGNHTFAITVSSPAGGGRLDMTAGQMYVTDFRR